MHQQKRDMKELLIPASLVLTLASVVWGASAIKSTVDGNTKTIEQLLSVTQNLANASNDQLLLLRELQINQSVLKEKVTKIESKR